MAYIVSGEKKLLIKNFRCFKSNSNQYNFRDDATFAMNENSNTQVTRKLSVAGKEILNTENRNERLIS